jgi:hypothetical protein
MKTVAPERSGYRSCDDTRGNNVAQTSQQLRWLDQIPDAPGELITLASSARNVSRAGGGGSMIT